MDNIIPWLLDAGEPWTRFRTLVDLEGRSLIDPIVQQTRQNMLVHPKIQALIATAATWGAIPLKRHNDASHPLYHLSTLADFGVRYTDQGMQTILESVLSHQSAAGAFQTLSQISPRYGGSGDNQWAWLNCDAPTVLYILKAMDAPDGPGMQSALQHLVAGAGEKGWLCASAAELGGFRGPGAKMTHAQLPMSMPLRRWCNFQSSMKAPSSGLVLICCCGIGNIKKSVNCTCLVLAPIFGS